MPYTDRVKQIIASDLIYDELNERLKNEGILREPANDKDVIWQQMTLDNFKKLCNSKSLYFSRFDRYGDNYHVERVHSYYGDTCYGEDGKLLKGELEELSSNMYFSCWYNSNDLADIIFNEYTQKAGIAVGTSVETLVQALKSAVTSNKIEDDYIYCGNIQYVRSADLKKKACFEKRQLIAPVFMKPYQYLPDQEYRICYYDKAGKNPEKKNKCLFLGLENLNFIEKVALPNHGPDADAIRVRFEDNYAKYFRKLDKKTDKDFQEMDGFTIYKREQEI